MLKLHTIVDTNINLLVKYPNKYAALLGWGFLHAVLQYTYLHKQSSKYVTRFTFVVIVILYTVLVCSLLLLVLQYGTATLSYSLSCGRDVTGLVVQYRPRPPYIDSTLASTARTVRRYSHFQPLPFVVKPHVNCNFPDC